MDGHIMNAQALGSCNVVQVSCGGHHTAVLTAAGAVWTWGFDDDGRLGHGQPGHLFVPRQVETLRDEVITQISCGCWHSAAISSTGKRAMCLLGVAGHDDLSRLAVHVGVWKKWAAWARGNDIIVGAQPRHATCGAVPVNSQVKRK